MRVMPVYLLCATLAAAAKSEETANYFGRRLEPVEVTADQETVSYLLPRLTSKYRPNSQWSPVTDPRFYVLTEMETNGDNQVKRLVNMYLRVWRNFQESVSLLLHAVTPTHMHTNTVTCRIKIHETKNNTVKCRACKQAALKRKEIAWKLH